ncbi:MAG: isoprenyl transferase [Dehalococcoidales bacterium]|nr:isoprenyl transferase [Dehalococcoidales bacterium]
MQSSSQQETIQIPADTVPKHVAIIMDGNGRWAQQRGQPRLAGHRAGVQNIRRVVEASAKYGIATLTLYAFSTENWGRPLDEVRHLMFLLEEALEKEAKNLHAQGVRLRHLGELDALPGGLGQRIRRVLDLTANNKTITLNIAFNYGGRAEIVQAVRRIVQDGLAAEEINEDTITRHLYTAGQKDPDIIIRTGGEMRLSNFLIWQAAYAEYYSTPVFWPDFDEAELLKALTAYSQRQRRFGKI